MRTTSSVACVVTMGFLAGCGLDSRNRAYEYMPDMVRDPAYKAFAPNPVTPNGLTIRDPVPGTIARGYHPFRYSEGEAEAARAGRELGSPFPATPDVLRDGQALYQIYCLVCHGPEGRGDGPLAGKIPTPPSYTSDRVLEFPAGRIYHVITMGSGKMPSYAPQLRPDERWKIVAYVRKSLQHLEESPQ